MRGSDRADGIRALIVEGIVDDGLCEANCLGDMTIVSRSNQTSCVKTAFISAAIVFSIATRPFRAATAAQLSPDGDGTRSIVEGQLGVDYQGLSLDAIYSHVNDAISSASLPVGFAPTAAQLANADRDSSRERCRIIPP